MRLPCVTYGELIPEVITYNTLRSLVAHGNVQRLKRGGGEGSPALIVYNSLPEKYRKRYEEKYGGTPEDLYKKMNVKERFKTDGEAMAFYEAFEYELNGVQTHLSEGLKEEYTVNASVLNVLIESLDSMRSQEKKLNNPRRALWDIISANSERLRYRSEEERNDGENPVHTLPRNLNRLKDTVREYRPAIEYEGRRYPHNYLSLISGKIGNKNTLKITPEVGELLLAFKRSRNPVFTDRQIFERFNLVELPAHNESLEVKIKNGAAEAVDGGGIRDVETGEVSYMWMPLKSLRSLVRWFNDPEIVKKWYDAEHGEQAARQRFKIGFDTEIASCRDARWEGDGTKLNLYYRDREGKRCTCTVYEVIDTYSEALLGYCISDREDYRQQYNAFCMAVRNTRRKPYEIVTDNQGGAKTKRMQDFMKGISHIAHTTMPNNPQSKTVESVFGRFQQQVLHQVWGFT
ncbi:MAG: transposase family protein [Dysgonamonadaceae bacterium]|jgi:hypothetical protein|nr:transposase family protein [Dysgonamonadaceae bacterium]